VSSRSLSDFADYSTGRKLPRFRLYDLRHTFATHLLAEGALITYVAAQLGHKKPTTTLLFYQRVEAGAMCLRNWRE
jgi:integrase